MIVLGHTVMILGALFILLAALGVLRMPDLMTRMHATTKAGAFGAGLMLFGVMLEFDDLSLQVRALAIILFITLTTPVAAHAIGHAGYLSGARLWGGTLKDDLKRQGDADNQRNEAEASPDDGSQDPQQPGA